MTFVLRAAKTGSALLGRRRAHDVPHGPAVRRVGGLIALALLAGAIGWTAAKPSATASPSQTPVAQPVIGLPASSLSLIGSSPAESPGETWSYSRSSELQILRYTQEGGWRRQPQALDSSGAPIARFSTAPGPLAGHTTAAGGVALLGETGEGQSKEEQLLVRDPGGDFREAPTPAVAKTGGGESSAPLQPGEQLFSSQSDGVLMTAVEQPDRTTGVFVVPAESGTTTQEGVLFYEDRTRTWSREPICLPGSGGCAKPASGFKVLAIEASSAENAWLLATDPAAKEGLVLLDRTTAGGEPRWVPRTLGPAGSWGAQFAKPQLDLESAETHQSVQVRIAALTGGQPLTVTGAGVWIDGQLAIGPQQQTVGFTLYYDVGEGQVSSSWCSAPAEASSLCANPLASGMPSGDYRSFAWSTGGGRYGQRVITGLDDGNVLSLQGTSFERVLGAGGRGGASAGAAFSSPQEGWLADDSSEGLVHLTTEPEPNRTQPWPVPFRRPLTAIATQPGRTLGELGAQAIAVGQEGQVAHYTPGQGWAPEALLDSSGVAQTPSLRGVAWPEPGRAYAVGTNGAMWLWQSATGLWEPDPARPPNLFLANFTGIAFDPSDPARGYAVGQQGLLLAYGKTWQQEELPAGLAGPEGANFTSIAFAGTEALVTYQLPIEEGGSLNYSGGVLCNDGDSTGWHVDVAAQSALGGEIPLRVAGLPDGGAALASAGGQVLERQGAGAPCGQEGLGSSWQPSSAGLLHGFPAALALFREGGALRAVASIDTTGTDPLGMDVAGDRALLQPPSAGQAPVATSPYTLPGSGYLLRETPSGWRDEEHDDYPKPEYPQNLPPGQSGLDWSYEPDAVLALALNPSSGQGWAVGGQTGELNDPKGGQYVEDIETAGVMRYPAEGAVPAGFSSSPVQVNPTEAAFAIGGDAQCASACADVAGALIGPDAWLSNAVSRAAQTPGVRAFLYTGPRLAPGLASSPPSGALSEAELFGREEGRYAQLLTDAAGSLGVFAAPTEYDLDSSGTLASFSSAFQSLGAPQGSAAPAPGVAPTSGTGPGVAYYSFDSVGAAGTVRVIVLDYSQTSLGAAQQCWLAQQLSEARQERTPAIAIGNRPLTSNPELHVAAAADAAQVGSILVTGSPPPKCTLSRQPGGASAYFFDAPEQNRAFPISAGGESIPSFGSGTLGYVQPPLKVETQFLGASSFMLAEVDVAKREADNRAKVSVRLIPNISELALDATNGVLLRRSQAALFRALARTPPAGMKCGKSGAECLFTPDPYIPIPSTCQGSGCVTGLLPDYNFTSSKPDVGDFVEPDPASPDGTTVFQGQNGKPIPDSHSGLFCAYNAGTTTVTVQTGGLAYSEQITVLAGSVEQPCGTAPLRNPPAPIQQAGLPVPLPAPAPTPSAAPNPTLPPPLPPPPPPPPVQLPTPPRAKAHLPSIALPLVAPQLFPLIPLVPGPAPGAGRPTPPSGTAQVPSQSPVSQQVSVSEREESEENAIEHVNNMAAYDRTGEPPLPGWTLGLLLIAAAAGVGVRRLGKRSPQYARAERRK